MFCRVYINNHLEASYHHSGLQKVLQQQCITFSLPHISHDEVQKVSVICMVLCCSVLVCKLCAYCVCIQYRSRGTYIRTSSASDFTREADV